MKELSSFATNTLAAIEDGKLVAKAEVAVIVSETAYRMTSANTVARERAVETLRFVASTESLRIMGKRLLETADEIDAEIEKAKEAS